MFLSSKITGNDLCNRLHRLYLNEDSHVLSKGCTAPKSAPDFRWRSFLEYLACCLTFSCYNPPNGKPVCVIIHSSENGNRTVNKACLISRQARLFIVFKKMR